VTLGLHQAEGSGMKWSGRRRFLGFVGVVALAYGTLVKTGGQTDFSPDTLEFRGRKVTHLLYWPYSYRRNNLVEYLIEKAIGLPFHPIDRVGSGCPIGDTGIIPESRLQIEC
jgi:hypothetical protein